MVVNILIKYESKIWSEIWNGYNQIKFYEYKLYKRGITKFELNHNLNPGGFGKDFKCNGNKGLKI